MPLSASRRPLSPSSDNKRIQQQISVLIDLPLPYGNIENIQRLVNDIVLTKVVDG